MTTSKSKLLTAADLLRLSSQGIRGELVRGELHKTMPLGFPHGRVVMRLGSRMENFIEARQLGHLMGSDSGVLLERDPDTVREPEIAFFSVEKIPLDETPPGYAEVVPDLVVEVMSPGDNRCEVREKALMWLAYGALLVWVVDPETRSVQVHREGHAALTLTENDSLDGLDALPGFTCAVRDLFGS